MRPFVAKERAFDAFLLVPPVLGMSPNKHGVSCISTEDNLVSGSNEEIDLGSQVPAGVMSPE
jgi:hypothetical protein